MGAETRIEWCSHSWSPWRGCTKVSPGCRSCYAESLSKRNPKVLGVWGPNGTRVIASEAAWKLPLRWNREACKAGERRRVFPSLCDPFEDRPELVAPRVRLFRLITETPNLDWLLLSKRPENALRLMVQAGLYAVENPRLPCPQPNLWIGVSVEDQQRADERIPALLEIPAAMRFLSVEPLLGPVDLTVHLTDPPSFSVRHLSRFYRQPDGSPSGFNERGDGKPYDRVVKHPLPLHWIIVGGESGPGARPCHDSWVRSIVQQCRAAAVPVFVKQLGANSQDWYFGETPIVTDGRLHRLKDRKGGDPDEWPEDLRVREFPATAPMEPATP